MHFDPRTQRALREVGLDDEDLRRASELVTEAVAADAEELEAFFAANDTVYSDMSMAHSASEIQEHAVDHFDCYTHGADLRGYLRFDSWGVYVEGGRPLSVGEGGRPLSVGKVELSLGPTVNDRVRFADDPDRL